MTNFTPGPWRVEGAGTSTAQWNVILADDYSHDDGSPHEVASLETFTVRRDGMYVEVPDAPTLHANARLIASAPDLYAALKAAEWGGMDTEIHQDHCPACRHSEDIGHSPDCQLAAALRKAEGGTP